MATGDRSAAFRTKGRGRAGKKRKKTPGSRGDRETGRKKALPAQDLTELRLIRRLTPKLPDSAMKVEYDGFSFEFRRSYHRKGMPNPYGATTTVGYFTINRTQWDEMRKHLTYEQITEIIRREIRAKEGQFAADAGVAVVSGAGGGKGTA